MSRKCQSKNPSTCKLHGTGGQLAQLEAKSEQAIQQGNLAIYFELKEKMDTLTDDVSDQKKVSFFGKLFGGAKESTKNPLLSPEPEPEVVPTTVITPKAVPTGVEMVPCGECDECDPPPSDMFHFAGYAGRGECSRPVPKVSQSN